MVKEIALSKIKQNNIKRRILFTEGWNKNIQIAAKFLNEEGYIEPILLVRNNNDISKDLKDIKLINLQNLDIDLYANFLLELRKDKISNLQEAQSLASQPNYLSALLLKKDEVDGVVCGVEYLTRDTLKPALQILKSSSQEIVTSLMILEKQDQLLVFGDVSLCLNPTAQELANITKNIALFCKESLNLSQLNVAMLSYSTNGSGIGQSVSKVKEAYQLVIQDKAIKDTKINIYGEMQFDAAYVKEVRTKKATNCKWSDNANIFIFPNLDAGNIGYKIMERCAGYTAIGPIVIGLEKPMNDLSRGASVQSIIEIAYITASQVKGTYE